MNLPILSRILGSAGGGPASGSPAGVTARLSGAFRDALGDALGHAAAPGSHATQGAPSGEVGSAAAAKVPVSPRASVPVSAVSAVSAISSVSAAPAISAVSADVVPGISVARLAMIPGTDPARAIVSRTAPPRAGISEQVRAAPRFRNASPDDLSAVAAAGAAAPGAAGASRLATAGTLTPQESALAGGEGITDRDGGATGAPRPQSARAPAEARRAVRRGEPSDDGEPARARPAHAASGATHLSPEVAGRDGGEAPGFLSTKVVTRGLATAALRGPDAVTPAAQPRKVELRLAAPRRDGPRPPEAAGSNDPSSASAPRLPSLPFATAPADAKGAATVTTSAPAPAAPLPPPPPGTDVAGALLRSAAHLKVDAGALGAVDLHLRVRDGAVHLRVDGDAAHLVEARSGELTRALASEGLKVASIELPRPEGSGLQPQTGDRGESRRQGWDEAASAREAAAHAPKAPARAPKAPRADGSSIEVQA